MHLHDRAELIRLMKKQGWSTRTLARECGLQSHGMIQQLRAGTKTSCRPELAAAIAAALKVNTGLLFDVCVSNTATHAMSGQS